VLDETVPKFGLNWDDPPIEDRKRRKTGYSGGILIFINKNMPDLLVYHDEFYDIEFYRVNKTALE